MIKCLRKNLQMSSKFNSFQRFNWLEIPMLRCLTLELSSSHRSQHSNGKAWTFYRSKPAKTSRKLTQKKITRRISFFSRVFFALKKNIELLSLGPSWWTRVSESRSWSPGRLRTNGVVDGKSRSWGIGKDAIEAWKAKFINDHVHDLFYLGKGN